jgi:hypothetical protein
MCDSHTGDRASLFWRSPVMSRLSDSQEIFKVLSCHFLGRTESKHEEISVYSGVAFEFWAWHLPNTSQGLYLPAILLSDVYYKLHRLYVCTRIIGRAKAKFTVACITTRKEYSATQQYVRKAAVSPKIFPANGLRKRSEGPVTYVDFGGHRVKSLSALGRECINISHSHVYS